MALSDVASMERKLIKVLFAMESRGILIDHEYTLKALAYEGAQIEESRSAFKELTGENFKDSNKLFADIFTRFGDKYPTTDKGNPSFTAAVLEDIDTPVARAIKKFRNHEKRYGTFYSSFIHYSDIKNRIHPTFNQGGAATGRMSCSSPNLQQVPAEEQAEGLPFVVRGCFIPDSGEALVSIDYSQMEYKIMASYAKETQLINRIKEGFDTHKATADLVGISRSQAKTLNFALLYGAGVGKLAGMLGIPEYEAKELRQLYFSRLPNIKRFMRRVMETGESRGYIHNWLGRRYYIDRFEDSYRLPNYLVQGSGADIVKCAMVRIQEELGDVGMLLQIHDEILLSMSKDKFDLIPKIATIMEDVFLPTDGIKLTVDVDHSYKSWAKRDKVEGIPT